MFKHDFKPSICILRISDREGQCADNSEAVASRLVVNDDGSRADTESRSGPPDASGIGGIGDSQGGGGHSGGACLSDVDAVSLPVDDGQAVAEAFKATALNSEV